MLYVNLGKNDVIIRNTTFGSNWKTLEKSILSNHTENESSTRISTTSDKDVDNILENRLEISRSRRPLSSYTCRTRSSVNDVRRDT